MLPAMIDIIIMVLLAGTLVYAVVLDRRMRKLMATLKEMEPMVGAFSSAVDQSARSVAEMRDLSVAAQQAVRQPAPAAAEDTPRSPPQQQPPLSPAHLRAARLKGKAPVSGQAAVPGKSDLVRTFFDITKERK